MTAFTRESIIEMGKRRRKAILRNIASGNPGTAWSDVEALLAALGATRHERAGSAVVFTLNDVLLRVHRVHGRRECGAALVARVRTFLERAGAL